MNNPIFESEQGNEMLAKIHEGMTVYSRDDEKIGEVEQVYVGEAGETQPTVTGPTAPEEGTLMNLVAEIFDPDEDLPETIAKRLIRSGFIRVEAAGFFGADRYIVPDQIAGVSDDGVRLRVTRDELIKSG